ncbi:Platelet-activating factor acetylhydrolase [Rhizophlyctis rosea]|nr:Platelet-activating factor acetylhydrolase [Rhizophlyctis rosea]
MPHHSTGTVRGHYPVGVLDIETPRTANQKGVLFRLYYPTTISAENHSHARWLPNASFYSVGYGDFFKIPGWLSLGVFYPLAASTTMPAYSNAPLLPSSSISSHSEDDPATIEPLPKVPDRLPVIVFSHGLGGTRTTYSQVCCDLASHGFIAAAVEHRDGSATVASVNAYAERVRYRRVAEEKALVPEGMSHEEYLLRERKKQVAFKDEEIGEVVEVLRQLDEGREIDNLMKDFAAGFDLGVFKGRFDWDKCAAAGHSFGGATALTSLSNPKRPFGVGIIFDPWMHAVGELDITKPFITIQSETFHWRENLDPISRLLSHPSHHPSTKFIVIRNTAHQDFSDFPSLFPFVSRKLGLGGSADPHISLALCDELVMKFLKGQWGLVEELAPVKGAEVKKPGGPGSGEPLFLEGEKGLEFLFGRLAEKRY